MAGNEFTRFQKVNNCKMVWLVQNVYQCRSLRKTCIDGPEYAQKSVKPFPWALKLGQTTNKKKKGISLYIKGVNLPEAILVHLHVYVRKQMSLLPLLDKKFRVTFHSEKVWESPLLVTNDDFDKEPLTENPCGFWEIHIELMWNETEYPKISEKKNVPDNVSKLLVLKEIGSDLKKFYKNKRFSDISIWCDNEEIPLHKAILEARCPCFMLVINSHPGGDWRETFTGLSSTKDKDAMNAFLMYLYTGDIESLMDRGPLPAGIYKCARQLRMHDLEWLTSPTQMCGFTRILPVSMKHDWSVGRALAALERLYEIFKNEDESRIIRSEKKGDDRISFTLYVKFHKSNYILDYISVFLEVEEMVKESVYFIFEVTVTNKYDEKVTKKCSGDMTRKSSIGIPELISIENLSGISDVILTCSIRYYDGSMITHIDKMSVSCGLTPKKFGDMSSPEILGNGFHGWLNLSADLGQLLLSKSYSDCCIVVGDHRFPCHRVILGARSCYFSMVLNAKEDECIGSSNRMEILVEKDIKISPEMMRIILEEIYSGFSNFYSQSAQDVYKFAKFFGLKALEMKCKKCSVNN